MMFTQAQKQTLARHDTTALMATDALAALSDAAVLDVIEAHLEARPLDARQLEEMTDRLRRIAWKLERGELS